MPLDLLVVTALSRRHQARIAEANVHVHMAEDGDRRAAAIAEHGERIRAVLTIGTIGFSAAEMDALPQLGLICAQGVGYENIDLAAARQRGIAVTHGPGTNAETVADHTFALTLASLRRVVEGDSGLRAGEWQSIRRSAPNLHGATLGLLGMGAVGRAIAHRAHYGFSMPVVYYSRSAKPDLPWRHESDPLAVAQQADVLVAALPGGADTRHLVDARLLAALGERGTFVNVGRGSVVDTEALITALREARIAGAGLDVFETEPEIPEEMKTLQRLVMTPHTAGLSPQALDATIERVIDNLKAFEEGREPVTPVG